MSDERSKNFDWIKLGKREVSNFVGHEMIYDFITHELDAERRRAVENFLFESKDAQSEMMKMLNGIQYAERLSETVVSEMIIAHVNEPSSYLAVLLAKTNFQNWPTSLKWAIEAIVVVSFIFLISIFMPWHKISKLNPFPVKKEAILAEFDKLQQVGDPNKLREMEVSQTAEYAEEEKEDTSHAATVAATSVKSVTEIAPVAAAPQEKAPEIPVAETGPAPTTILNKRKAEPVVENKKSGEGFIFRGEIAVANLEVVRAKITEKIIALGGRKAGEVELGWIKSGQTKAYYHFTLPEAKYQELVDFLSGYGKPKVSKDKHPRVMPDGIIRLIFNVDEASR